MKAIVVNVASPSRSSAAAVAISERWNAGNSNKLWMSSCAIARVELCVLVDDINACDDAVP